MKGKKIKPEHGWAQPCYSIPVMLKSALRISSNTISLKENERKTKKMNTKGNRKENARKEKKIDLGFLPIGPNLGHWRDRKSGISLRVWECARDTLQMLFISIVQFKTVPIDLERLIGIVHKLDYPMRQDFLNLKWSWPSGLQFSWKELESWII